MKVQLNAYNELFANAVVEDKPISSRYPQFPHVEDDIQAQYPMLKGKEIEVERVVVGACSADVLTSMPYVKVELDEDSEYEYTDNYYFKISHTEELEVDIVSTSDKEVEKAIRDKYPHVNLYSKIEVEFDERRVA